MNMPATIRAEAHVSAIKSVTRLYNGSIEDITNELLQNARRAGATQVKICFDPEKQTISFEDNGHGIADPASLLQLGSSNWDGDVTSEDCAGMGFFSAASLEVEVISSGIHPDTGDSYAWGATIGADDWTGEKEIPVEVYPHAAQVMTTGTRFCILLSDMARFPFLKPSHGTPADELLRKLERCTKYFPLPVTFNGEPMKSENDMLEGCKAVYDFGAYRIGVSPYHASYNERQVNFHGITITANLPEISEVQSTIWSCRVDVIDARELQLVLPARKEVVKNAAWEKLVEHCVASIYRTIADLARNPEEPRPHRLAFERWLHAAAYDIDMPVAAPALYRWVPVDGNSNREISKLETIGDNAVLIDCGTPNESHALADALERSPEAFPYTGYRPEPNFKGYQWYDKLSSFHVSAIEVVLNEGDTPVDVCEPAVAKSGLDDDEMSIADQIMNSDKFVAAINFVLNDTTGQKPNAAIAGQVFIGENDYDFDSAAILLTRDHGFTPNAFSAFASMSSFVASDDRDADSHDTQLARFDEEAIRRFLALTGDEAAVLRFQIEEALKYVRYSIPENGSITVTLARDGLNTAIISFDKPCTHVEISTAHLTKEVSDILDTLQDTAENREMPSAGHCDWRDGVVVSPYRYGAWVRRFSDGIEYDDMPECLKACFAYAAQRGAAWILFDRDADIVDGLPSFEW